MPASGFPLAGFVKTGYSLLSPRAQAQTTKTIKKHTPKTVTQTAFRILSGKVLGGELI